MALVALAGGAILIFLFSVLDKVLNVLKVLATVD